jgi:hypothetical protein
MLKYHNFVKVKVVWWLDDNRLLSRWVTGPRYLERSGLARVLPEALGSSPSDLILNLYNFSFTV